jgi:hypothetical protein
MNHRKHGLVIVAICAIAALAVTALIASITQAEPTANWKVNGANVTAILKPLAGAELEKLPANGPKHLILLSMRAGKKVAILCEELIATGVLLTQGGSTANIELRKCQTSIEEKFSEACTPKEPITAKAKDLIVLNGGLPYDFFEPASGASFGTIGFGAGCVLGEALSITGSFYANESIGKFETELVTHLFVEAALGVGGLRLGGEPMTIDGSANISLLGGHAGAKWSGIPG